MFRPDLSPRIEKALHFSGEQVQERDSIRFMVIAQCASKPEVLFLSRPAQRLRNDVVELHGRADDGLCGKAIPATIAGLSGHSVPDWLWNVSTAHVPFFRQETSCPRW